MDLVNMREMLEAGFHFGHQTTRWDPRMKPYIFTEKNGIYIIDLQKSLDMAKKAFQKIKDVASEGKEVLMVGTKRQAQAVIQNAAEEVGMHYIDKRWIGGLLTNFTLVRKSIDKLLELDEMKNDGRWEIKSKKEQSKLEKVYKKLRKSLWGVRNLNGIPSLLLVIDTNFEEIAVKEGNKLNIPIVAIVDTNSDPTNIDFPIPGNDDAIRSIKLFVKKFTEAYKIGKDEALAKSLEIPSESDESSSAPGEGEVEAKVKEETEEPVLEKNKEEEKLEVQDKPEEKQQKTESKEAEVRDSKPEVIKEEVKTIPKKETKAEKSPLKEPEKDKSPKEEIPVKVIQTKEKAEKEPKDKKKAKIKTEAKKTVKKETKVKKEVKKAAPKKEVKKKEDPKKTSTPEKAVEKE